MSFLIYLAAGFLSGLIGGMGMGGGTVMIPVLTIFCGVPQHLAQAANLISFLPMSALSLAVHKKQGLVRAQGLVWLILPAAATAVLGGLAALMLPAEFLHKLFGAFLIVLALKGALQLASSFKKGCD